MNPFFTNDSAINKEKLEEYVKKISNLKISEKLKKIGKTDLIVSSDYKILYPSAMSDSRSIWHAVEKSYASEKDMNEAICCMFNSERWKKFQKIG